MKANKIIDIDALWAHRLNKELLSMYKSLGTLNISEETKKRLSAPLRTMVGPAFKPENNLLIVGEETYHGLGGKTETVVSSFHSYESYHGKYSGDYILMEVQSDFMLNRYNHASAKTQQSPFWKACAKISGVGHMTDLLSAGVAWSDLMTSDLDGGSPLERGAMNSKELDVFLGYSLQSFKGNLGITTPKVAMIFAGPKYDFFLEECFNLPQNWKKDDLRSLPECSDPEEKLLQHVNIFQHNGTLFVKTYHPGFLTWQSKYGYLKILDILAETFARMGVTKQ